MKINLNDSVKVKLTDWGKEIYYHQYDRTNQIAGREICKPKFPKEDENGYTEFQLWCFIELYGMHMGITLPNVIEPLEIVYESEKGEKNQSEIMRCKDCKYSTDFYGDGECYCRRPNRLLDWIGDWNFYCGAAERREGSYTVEVKEDTE